jgi:major membrane immunogen (membrane-anchored lipoprotein)
MKKMMVLMVLALLLAGCGKSAMRSEFYQHDSIYKSWDHMRFSWFGYRNPTDEDMQKSIDQGWWGIELPYVAGK